MIKSGTIAKATWEISQSQKPYILLEIDTEPINFHETILTKLFKEINPIGPLFLNQVSSITELEKAIDTRIPIPWEGSTRVGQEIPEVTNKPIAFNFEWVETDGQVRPFISKVFPPK